MKNNGLKNAKAITLIAMVVTIIVLLILAGVSIAVLTGENGILNRVTSAKKTSEEAEVMENIKLAFNNSQIGRYAGEHSPTDYDAMASSMLTDLGKTYPNDNTLDITSNGDGTFVVTAKGKSYDVDANGNVTKQGASIVVGEATFKDASGNNIETKIQGEGTVYIHFTASLAGGTITDVTVTEITPNGLTASTPTLTNGEWVTAVTANGTYTFNITGSSEDGQKTATKSVVMNKFSNLPSGLQIGSIVIYNPIITNSASNHTFNWEAELCSSDKVPTSEDRILDITGTGDNNMAITRWMVFSIDEDNDEIELISASLSPNTVYLGEAQGYNNGVYLLNNACDNLYGGVISENGDSYRIKGRSLNIKDIEDRMTDTALNAEITGAHRYSVDNAIYGEQTDSVYPNKYYPLIYAQEDKSVINGNTNTSSKALNTWKQLTPIHRTDSVNELQMDGTTAITKAVSNGEVVDGKVEATTSIQPYQTFWSKDQTFFKTAFKAVEGLDEVDGSEQNINYKMLQPSYNSCWLASRCVRTASGRCYFGINFMSSGVGGRGLFYSDGVKDRLSCALRPIVTVSTKVISKSQSNQFTIGE